MIVSISIVISLSHVNAVQTIINIFSVLSIITRLSSYIIHSDIYVYSVYIYSSFIWGHSMGELVIAYNSLSSRGNWIKIIWCLPLCVMSVCKSVTTVISHSHQGERYNIVLIVFNLRFLCLSTLFYPLMTFFYRRASNSLILLHISPHLLTTHVYAAPKCSSQAGV